MDSTLRKIVLEMGADALKDLIGIIKARPDVAAVEIVMTSDVVAMDKYYHENREAVVAGEVPDESA